MSTEVAETDTLWVKQRHTHVAVERRRNSKATRAVHTTHLRRPHTTHTDTHTHQPYTVQRFTMRVRNPTSQLFLEQHL